MSVRRRTGLRHLGAVGAGLVLVLSVAACGGDDGTATSTSQPATSTSPVSNAPTTSSSVPAGATSFTVYLVRDEKLMAAGRSTSAPVTPATALRALLAGPQGSLERDLGMTTSIPAGTALHGVHVAGDVATVDLSKAFESGGGSQSMQARAAQVVFTATQFSGVSRVRFAIDGTPVTTIGGEGLIVDRVGRTDFENVTPAILIESPTPGATVHSPLRVRGTSNTFEAVVNYTIADPDGIVIAEASTMATAGTGTWGTFTFTVPYRVARAGMGSVIVYQRSPKDGSRTDVMEVPVVMEP
jgi:immunoglobulin-like protein involved in spore germination/sporulation and spore germination protein